MIMADNVEELLKKRFIEAIRKSFQPCPLIGPKWFHYDTKADPPCFRFWGLRRLAKALGMRPEKLAERLVKEVDLGGVKAQASVEADSSIVVRLSEGKGPVSK